MMRVSACQRFAVMLGIPMSSSLYGRSPPCASLSSFSHCPEFAFCSEQTGLAGGRDCHLMEDIAPSRHMLKRPFTSLRSHSLFVRFSQHPVPAAEQSGSDFDYC